MKNKLLIALATILAATVVAESRAATNINDTNAYSYGANVGFMNWRGDGANGVVLGRYITSGLHLRREHRLDQHG